MLDREIKGLAALALRNAFWQDFSGLVNEYLKASNGLDIPDQEVMMGEMTSIYGRDKTLQNDDVFLNIHTRNGERGTTGFDTIFEALSYELATEVWLRGVKVFEKRDDAWYFLNQNT